MDDQIKITVKRAFSNSFLFYLKTHFYHWNVEGRMFAQDHELFGKIYAEVQESLDAFAEHIRTLDSYAPGTFDRFKEFADIQQESNVPSAEQMYANLLEDNKKVIVSLNDAFAELEQRNNQGFADFIAGRLDAHKKHEWMLRSTLKS
jgi:starvation-inducible DNA-binding protein